jgi:serine/threonine protein kinase
MNSTLHYDPDRHRRLRELVDRPADRPAAEWAAFLERECPTDPALESEALRLLQHALAASAEGFLDPTATAAEPGSVCVTHGERVPRSDGPTHVGKYRIARCFSQVSGQAAAYLAFDPDLERHVVLKRYHGRSSEAEEGRALAKVVSPYVARCYGIERIDGDAYLVVEYVPGRNLAEVRRDGPLDLAQAVSILAQLAEGVAAVHVRGLIHRDIKPANVILHDDGTPRLVDFGLAAHLGSSRLCERSGSPPYMAPEQARGEWDRIDFRTDVFGLGGVLYKLLTNHEPHAGSTLTEILEHAEKADITSPRQYDPTIPALVEAVCLKALAAAPENRYTTAPEFAAALRQASEPTSITPPTPAKIHGWVRWCVPAAVVACGLLALAVWRWSRGPETATAVDLSGISKPAAGPL